MPNRNTSIIIITVLFIMVSAGIVAFSLSRLPPQIPLWYSLPWGEGQLAPKIALFVLPAISLVFLIFNLVFSHFVRLKEVKEENSALQQKFFRESFIFISLAISLINLITIVKIVGLFL